MTAKTVVMVSATIELATAIALIIAPDFVARLLLGVGLSGGGNAVARVAGFALLSLAVACWPGTGTVATSSIRALLAYNLLTALYLGYLRVGGGFAGYLLWPACALHALLALLLARPAYETVRGKKYLS